MREAGDATESPSSSASAVADSNTGVPIEGVPVAVARSSIRTRPAGLSGVAGDA